MKNSTLEMAEERKRITKMRNKELLRDYRRVLNEAYESNQPINRHDIIKKVLLESRPHYYVNFDHAYNVIMHINSKNEVAKKTRLKQNMWIEIYHKVKETQEKQPSLTLSSALARVLATERASRYYISEAYAYKYLYNVCRQSRNINSVV